MESMQQFLKEEYPDMKEETSSYLAERFYKACTIYAVSINKDSMDSIVDCKMQYLKIKFKSNKELVQKILNKECRVKDILHKNIYDIDPVLNAARELYRKTQAGEAIKGNDTYACPRKDCRSRNHTEQQVMNRSSDEELAIKCQCLDCGRIFWR